MRFPAFLVLLMSSLVFACGGSASEEAADKLPERFVEAHAIQNEISEDAGRAEEILQGHGMTLDDWDALMAELEADPELAAAYDALGSDE